MIQNLYYIVEKTDPKINDILTFCVGDVSTIRENLLETQYVVKLPIGADIPGVLSTSGYASYDHSEILVEMAGTNWTDPNII